MLLNDRFSFLVAVLFRMAILIRRKTNSIENKIGKISNLFVLPIPSTSPMNVLLISALALVCVRALVVQMWGVEAHANAVRSEPAANSAPNTVHERVTIRFTEPLEARFSEIKAPFSYGARGGKGESIVGFNNLTTLMGGLSPLPDGGYTVGGHAMRGHGMSHETERGGLYIGIALALLGFLLLAAGVPMGGWYNRAGAVTMACGALVFVVGVWLVIGAQSAGDAQGGARNPILPTSDSIVAGRVMYERYCQSCHGETGRGDGPASANLESAAAADLVMHVPMHGDAELFDFIALGIEGTAMTGFGERLSDDEIWHMVNFIRALAEGD